MIRSLYLKRLTIRLMMCFSLLGLTYIFWCLFSKDEIKGVDGILFSIVLINIMVSNFLYYTWFKKKHKI